MRVLVIEPIAHVLAPMSPDVMIEIAAFENKLIINVFVLNLLEPVVCTMRLIQMATSYLLAHSSMH